MNIKFMSPSTYEISRTSLMDEYVALDEGSNRYRLIHGGMVIGFVTKDGKMKRHKEYPYEIKIHEPSKELLDSLVVEEKEVEIDEWDTIIYEEVEEEF